MNACSLQDGETGILESHFFEVADPIQVGVKTVFDKRILL